MRRNNSRSSRLRICRWPDRRGNSARPPGPARRGGGRAGPYRPAAANRCSSARQLLAHGRLEAPLVAEHAALLGLAGGEEDRPLAGHLPAQPPPQELLPAPPQLAQLRHRLLSSQPATSTKQRPFGQPLVLVEVLQRVAGKQVPLAVEEQLLQAGRSPAPCGGSRSRGTARRGRR